MLWLGLGLGLGLGKWKSRTHMWKEECGCFFESDDFLEANKFYFYHLEMMSLHFVQG